MTLIVTRKGRQDRSLYVSFCVSHALRMGIQPTFLLNVFGTVSPPFVPISDGNSVYPYYNRICYCDMVMEEFQPMCMFLSVRIRSTIRKMATVSTLLLSVYVIRIRIRLLYGNGNENRSFFHDGNEQFPSLLVTGWCVSTLVTCLSWYAGHHPPPAGHSRSFSRPSLAFLGNHSDFRRLLADAH